MIHVVVNVIVRAYALDRWLALIAYHAGQSRLEPGCLSFRVLRVLGSPCRYTLYETWASAAALESHRRTTHYARWRAEIGTIEAEPRTHEEYEELLSAIDRPKVMHDGAALAQLLAGSRIVFTNGCFDVLHAGHVAMLTEARAQGDCLVVGLNTDASVRRIKGPRRPVRPESERQGLLAALACVDYIIPFADDTPELLIQALRPEVLVKGGDYTLAEVVGADLVQSYGGRVHLAQHTGHSTTALLHELQGGVTHPNFV